MTLLKTGLLSLVCMVFLTGFDFGFGKDSPEEQRNDIDQTSEEILSTLYREVPGAQELVGSAAGYAVFSSLGMNVLAVSTANGKGVATYADSGRKVYMNMFSAGGGLGMGIKKYRLVFIFENVDALDHFVEQGWTAGAQADAAAKAGESGDAASLAIDVSPGVKLYQLTETGLALQATIQGTKYWADDDLN